MAIEWASNVNQKVLRNGTSWNNIIGFKTDETRSGKTKRRSFHSQELRVFTIKMMFNVTEYELFIDWYINNIKQGLLSFNFPKVDAINGEMYVYRFSKDGMPQFNNPTGDLIECVMKWEELYPLENE